jgi:hypothetical protein
MSDNDSKSLSSQGTYLTTGGLALIGALGAIWLDFSKNGHLTVGSSFAVFFFLLAVMYLYKGIFYTTWIVCPKCSSRVMGEDPERCPACGIPIETKDLQIAPGGDLTDAVDVPLRKGVLRKNVILLLLPICIGFAFYASKTFLDSNENKNSRSLGAQAQAEKIYSSDELGFFEGNIGLLDLPTTIWLGPGGIGTITVLGRMNLTWKWNSDVIVVKDESGSQSYFRLDGEDLVDVNTGERLRKKS